MTKRLPAGGYIHDSTFGQKGERHRMYKQCNRVRSSGLWRRVAQVDSDARVGCKEIRRPWATGVCKGCRRIQRSKDQLLRVSTAVL